MARHEDHNPNDRPNDRPDDGPDPQHPGESPEEAADSVSEASLDALHDLYFAEQAELDLHDDASGMTTRAELVHPVAASHFPAIHDPASYDAGISSAGAFDPAVPGLNETESVADRDLSHSRESESEHGWITEPPAPWPPKPGVFVMLWPMYLLIGCLVAVSPFLAARYVDTLVVDGTLRGIFAAFAVGLCVLMPLIRLSQSRSSRPLLESAMDAFSLLLPLQPLIWFAVVRPIDWRMDRVIAIDLHLIIHASLVAFISGITLAREGPGVVADAARRTLAMVALVALQLLPLAGFAMLRALGIDPPTTLNALSGVGGILMLASSPYEPVPINTWIGIIAMGNIALASWWITAGIRGSVKHRRGPDPDKARTVYSTR